MRTSKPFSTISYCKEEFLKERLDELVEDDILDFYSFVYHTAEEDEKKDHAHIYFRPASLMETNYIDKVLRQFDEEHPDKPLKCTIFVSSKFDDWYLYATHDKAYLSKKGQARKHRYVREQFITSDEDFFGEQIRCIDRSQFVGMERVVDAVSAGMQFSEMVRLGQVPIQLIAQYKTAYDLLTGNDVVRNGRETHTPKERSAAPAKSAPFLVDEETGEILMECKSVKRATQGRRKKIEPTQEKLPFDE